MKEVSIRNLEYALETHAEQSLSCLQGDSTKTVSYRDLLRDVQVAKQFLLEMGATPRSRVGILANNCYEWVVADLALIALDCISVAFPVEHFRATSLQELERRFGLNLLLAADYFPLQDSEAPVFPLSSIVRGGALERVPTLRSTASTESLPEDTYTLAFSSGTAGTLKCLKIRENGMSAYLSACADKFPLKSDDHLLIFLPLSVIAQRQLLYASILYGISCSIVQPLEVYRGLRVFEPTLLAAPPAIFEFMESRFNGLHRRESEHFSGSQQALRTQLGLGGKLRMAITCAAPCKLSTMEFFQRELGIPLLQCYGMSESGGLTFNWLEENRPGTVGKELYPGSLRVEPDGELTFATHEPVCGGYYGCSLEEERTIFRPDGRMATGDLATVDEEGYYRVVGRKKNVIVLPGGGKVQPEELEELISAHRAVSSVAVIGGDGLPYVCAVISLSKDHTQSTRNDVRKLIDSINARRPVECRVARAIFTSEPFTASNGLRNRSEKVNRAEVRRRFWPQIEGSNVSEELR